MEPLAHGRSAGGRPAARQAKHTASGARQANARSGGAPARRGRKPQDVPSRLHRRLEVPPGSLRTQVEHASEQLLGEGYMDAEVSRLSAFTDTDTVPSLPRRRIRPRLAHAYAEIRSLSVCRV